MKKALVVFLLVLCPPLAKAQWGCEVLLCLSNPAGPMAVSQCVDPIRRLYRHLALGRAFPSCEAADGSGTHAGIKASTDGGYCPADFIRPHVDVKDKWVCLSPGYIEINLEGMLAQRVWLFFNPDNPEETYTEYYWGWFEVQRRLNALETRK